MCNTYNRLVIRITDLYENKDLLAAKLDTLDQQKQDAVLLLATKGSDPAASQVADFMESLYFTLQTTTLSTLYDLSKAIGYASLSNVPLNVDGRNIDYASLKAKHAQLVTSIYSANQVGGPAHCPPCAAIKYALSREKETTWQRLSCMAVPYGGFAAAPPNRAVLTPRRL